MMLRSMAILAVLGLAGTAVAQDEDAEPPDLRKGDTVRFSNAAIDGMPSIVAVFQRQEDARRFGRHVAAARKVGQWADTEGVAYLGHNTAGTLLELYSVREIDGTGNRLARIRVEAGW